MIRPRPDWHPVTLSQTAGLQKWSDTVLLFKGVCGVRADVYWQHQLWMTSHSWTCKHSRRHLTDLLVHANTTSTSQQCEGWTDSIPLCNETQHTRLVQSEVRATWRQREWRGNRQDPVKKLSEYWQPLRCWHHLKETKGLRVNTEFVCKCFLTGGPLSFLCIMLAVEDYPTELIRQFTNTTDNSWGASLPGGVQYWFLHSFWFHFRPLSVPSSPNTSAHPGRLQLLYKCRLFPLNCYMSCGISM